MPYEVYANNPSAVVTSSQSATSGSQSWAVTGSTLPACTSSGPLPTQFRVADQAASSEIILVTSNPGGATPTLTVTRGAEGTAPVSHSAGFTITQAVTTGSLAALAAPGLYPSAFLAGVR